MTQEFSRRSLLGAGALGALLPELAIGRAPGISSTQIEAPVDETDAAWAPVRALFMLKPGMAYMNNASLGMPPRLVVEAVAAGYEAISREPLHGKHDLQEIIATRTIPGLAAMFGVEPDEIALTRNATEALHVQATGLALRPGDEVLISTQEHPAGRAPWIYRQAADGVVVREVFIPSPLETAGDVVARFEAEITERTRAISFCHVTRGGHMYPVRALCAMAKRHGLSTLVDGAQAVGQMPIDLRELGCDAYSASLHKWILAPSGTGFLYVAREARDRILSVFQPAATAGNPGIAPGGTADFPVRAATATALGLVNDLGLHRIEHRCRFLSDYLKAGLGDLRGVTLLSGPRDLSCPGSTIFEQEGRDAMAAVPWMEEVGQIHLDEHQRDGHNAIRVSTHIYNTTDEIDRLLAALS